MTMAHEHAAGVLEAHDRLRQASRVKGPRHRVEPKLPVDVVGTYVSLPYASRVMQDEA